VAGTGRCPGCSRPVGQGTLWCGSCGKRLPARLAEAVVTADRSLRAATAAAVVWLGQHPHATARELDLLVLAAQGRTNEEIADDLHLTLNTVRSGWRDLCKRWGCRGRGHAIATAFQLGYLSVGRKDVL